LSLAPAVASLCDCRRRRRDCGHSGRQPGGGEYVPLPLQREAELGLGRQRLVAPTNARPNRALHRRLVGLHRRLPDAARLEEVREVADVIVCRLDPDTCVDLGGNISSHGPTRPQSSSTSRQSLPALTPAMALRRIIPRRCPCRVSRPERTGTGDRPRRLAALT
jgi:hypothetical protein